MTLVPRGIARITLKGVRGHLVRFLLTALSVALGVSLIAGSFVLTDSIDSTFKSLIDSSTEGTDVVVRGPAGGASADGFTDLHQPVPIALADELGSVDGVARAAADLQGNVLLVGKDGTAVRNAGAPTFGFGYDPQSQAFRIDSGRPPEATGEIVVESTTLEKSGLSVGDRTKALVAGVPTDVTVVGRAVFRGPSAGATLVILPREQAVQAFAPDGTVQTISVTADAGVSQTDLASRIQAAIPSGDEAITGEAYGEEQSDQIDVVLGFITIFISIFGLIALFVGGFIIFNTFSMLVAQRTRELALLRAMGASQGQVIRIVLGEALVIGLAGSLIGLGIGVGLARLLQAALGAAGLDIAGGLPVRARTVILCLVAGLVVTLLAALLPALRAARIPPIAALRDDGVLTSASLRRRGLVGLVMGVVGVVLLVPSLFADDVVWPGVGAGAALLVIALVVGSPLLTRPVVRVIAAPFTLRRSTVGRLARENALRNPRRTSITAAALMIGLALIGGISVMAQSTKASVSDIVEEQLTSDYVLTGGNSPIPAPVAAAVAELPDVRSVADSTFLSGDLDGKSTSVGIGDPGPLRDNMKLAVTSGSLDALDRGQILVQDSTAEDNGWKVGTRLKATIGTVVDRTVTVGGIYEPNQILGTASIVPTALYEEAVPPDQRFSFGIYVKAAPGADLATLRTELTETVKPYLVVSVEDGDEFVDTQAAQVNQVLYLMYALLALAVIIAVLGIINTLALSVFERTREIGLLRAVGLGRRQLRRMIRIEAITTAVFGAVLGVVLGVVLGIAVQYGLRSQGLDKLAIPWGTLAIVLVFAAFAGVVAAILPAWRASRMDVLKAITTD